MQTLLHLREYTRILKRELPEEVFKPVPSRLLWLIPHLAVIGFGIAAIAALEQNTWAKLAIGILIGHSFACLGFLGHEVLHGSVVRAPWLRDAVGAICFAPFFLGPKLWRKWHNVEHHGHTQSDDEDPDAMGTLEDFRERKSLQLLYRIAPVLRSFFTFAAFSVWFSFHSFMMLLRFAPEFPARERRVVTAQFLLPASGAVLLAAWLRGDFLYAFVLPLLVANFIVMSYIATNHLLNPLTPTNDPLANSLTVTVPRWVDTLHFHFSHHTEHHIFPAVNPKYAPQIKAAVKRLWPERYNEMPHWKALLTLWRTPRLYRDNTSLIDPVRELTYPVLGHGLSPDRVVAQRRPLSLSDGQQSPSRPPADST
ncbi:MAG: acyl-CoA desaturase [Firmicutes bacterium]|nr:acyl-CoA desaturase [Bacillota bacterium]